MIVSSKEPKSTLEVYGDVLSTDPPFKGSGREILKGGIGLRRKIIAFGRY